MQVGVIGAGKIGATLAGKLVGAGHRVSITNSRGVTTLSAVAAETGAVATDITQVGVDADLVVVAIPFQAFADWPQDLLPKGVAVVDATNYVPIYRDPSIAELDAGGVESEWTQARLGRPVIKAFNSINVPSLRDMGQPAGTPDRIALSAAGDNASAKQLVFELINDAGYDTVDGGTLAESWRQQPGTPAFCTNLDVDGVRQALESARPEHTTQWRARMAARVTGI
jgi:predicted dinucleotide-binding enzyme